MLKWAIVQHSGGAIGKPAFANAVESKMVTKASEIKKVEKVGGILFDNYGEAEDFCDAANYPDDNMGIIPRARGTFASADLDGLRIYVPVREVKVTG